MRLGTPLLHSPRFGYMLVDAGLLRNAAESESYVLHHPQLDRAFARMRQLAEARKFAVTGIIIPSAPRLNVGAFGFVPAP